MNYEKGHTPSIQRRGNSVRLRQQGQNTRLIEFLKQREGFVFDREISAGAHHYGLLFAKPR